MNYVFVSGLPDETDSLPCQPHLSCFPGKMLLFNVISMNVDVQTTLPIITMHPLSVIREWPIPLTMHIQHKLMHFLGIVSSVLCISAQYVVYIG